MDALSLMQEHYEDAEVVGAVVSVIGRLPDGSTQIETISVVPD